MSDIQEYKISINFSTKNADKAKDDIDKVKKSVSSLKGTTAASKSATSGISKLTSSFGGLTKMLKGFVAIKTFEKMGQTIFKFANQTSDYIETVNLFRASMGDAADEAQKFIDKAEDMLGLDPSQMMSSISQFYNLAQGIGIADDRAYKMSQNLTQLAGDLSSFANISLETAQSKLMSGFSGQVKPLREYGIALDQATLQETAYSLGIQQRVKDMTRAQKTELIYYQIMQSTTKIQGDLGRSLLTPANSLRIMKTEFTKLARAIGSIFIPIIMKIIPVVRAVTQILTQAAQAIASFFGFKMSDFNADLDSVGNLLTGVSDDIDGVGDAAEDTTKKLNKMLMPFDELNNVNFDTGSAGSGAGAGVGSGGSLGIELPEYDMFASMSESMDGTINKIKEKLTTLFEPIKNSWDTHGKGVMEAFNYSIEENNRLWGDVGKSFEEVWMNGTGETTLNIIFGLLTNIFNIIGNIKGAFATAWETDGTGTQIVQNLWDGFNNLLDVIEQVSEAIEKFTSSPTFQKFATETTKTVEKISGWFKTLTETIKGVWENGGEETFTSLLDTGTKLVTLLEVLAQKLSPIIEFATKLAGDQITEIVKAIGIMSETLGGFIDTVTKLLEGDWGGAWKSASETIETMKQKISEFDIKSIPIFGNIFGFVVEKIQRVMEFVTNMKTAFEGFLQFFKGIFTGDFQSAWEGLYKGISGVISGILNTVTTIFNNIFNAITTPIRNAGNFIHDTIENIKGFFKFDWEFPKIKTPHLSWSTQPAPGWIANILRAINLPAEIPKLNVSWYEKGGFPNVGEFFFMNEAGPEMIGQIGNRTAVANQDQITTAIANATYNAISKALSENRSSEQPTIVQVNLGNEQLYQGYGKYKNEQANMLGVNIG